MVVFHLWPKVLPGGFIGVSVFFTLSGFLITRGLLEEIDRTGTFGLRSFWSRRLRRLWPASAATLALIVLVWLLCGWMSHAISIDVFASFLQVANWRFLAAGKAYGLTELSPVAHFWSLAIEEQLYLVVPLLLWCARRRTGALAGAFTGLILISLTDTVLNAGDAPVVYYSTVTRAAELAVGGLLAVALRGRRPRGSGTRSAPALGIAGAMAILLLAWLARSTSLGTEAYYRGGLTALTILSTIAILGAMGSTALTRLLSVRALVRLGAISYGVYLIHWPIHVALEHTDMPGWLQPWITLGLTLVIASISLRHYEDPIRLGRISMRGFAPLAAALSLTILIGSSIGLSIHPSTEIDFAAAQRQQAALAVSDSTREPTDTAAAIGTADHPARVAIFGDSTALMLGMGLGYGEPAIEATTGGAGVGCTIGRGGARRGDARTGDDPTTPVTGWDPACDWTQRWPDTVAADGGLDVAVVLTGNWDVAGRRVPALGEQWRTVGDPVYDDWLRSEIAGAADALHGAGATHVLWLTLPAPGGTAPNPRVERFDELVAEVAADRSWMRRPDLAGYIDALGPDHDPRPDGMHVTMGTTARVSLDWLDAVILDAVHRG